ncbi:MAG: hypothetical protein IKU45_03275 [Clostridia bacterium]|nr:hypothetical protein [Clostridia bacterium]
MKKSPENTRLLLTFSAVSAIFFIVGLFTLLSIPSNSFIYIGLERAVIGISKLNANASTVEKIGTFISSYFDEAKLLLFVFLSCFTIHRFKFFIGLCAFKGIASGMGCGIFLRTLPHFELSGWTSFFSSIIFVSTSVCSLLLVIYFCINAFSFSKRIIYPIRISPFFKRKDSRLFILDLFACEGILIIIMLLKIGNLFFVIS